MKLCVWAAGSYWSPYHPTTDVIRSRFSFKMSPNCTKRRDSWGVTDALMIEPCARRAVSLSFLFKSPLRSVATAHWGVNELYIQADTHAHRHTHKGAENMEAQEKCILSMKRSPTHTHMHTFSPVKSYYHQVRLLFFFITGCHGSSERKNGRPWAVPTGISKKEAAAVTVGASSPPLSPTGCESLRMHQWLKSSDYLGIHLQFANLNRGWKPFRPPHLSIIKVPECN